MHRRNNQYVVSSFSSRKHNNMSFVHGDTNGALGNRITFLGELGIDYRNLVCAKQAHSDNIVYASQRDKGWGALDYNTSVEATDAFITDIKDVPLAIFTADCLSVFLYDLKTQNKSIGIVHAGWRSTFAGITGKAISQMKEKFKTKPEDLSVGLGPAMRACCYAVGKEFSSTFPEHVVERNGRYYLDLIEANKKQAQEAGVDEVNIFDSGICTSCQNSDFFSFRREGKSCARMMSVIMLKDND